MSRLVWGSVLTLCLVAVGHAAAPLDIKAEVKAKCGLVPLGAVVLDGKIATKDEMQEGKNQVTIFMEATDMFQDCVLRVAESFKDKVTHKLTPKDEAVIVAIVNSSQKEKESLGKTYNEAVDAFNAAHKSNAAPSTGSAPANKPH